MCENREEAKKWHPTALLLRAVPCLPACHTLRFGLNIFDCFFFFAPLFFVRIIAARKSHTICLTLRLSQHMDWCRMTWTAFIFGSYVYAVAVVHSMGKCIKRANKEHTAIDSCWCCWCCCCCCYCRLLLTLKLCYISPYWRVTLPFIIGCRLKRTGKKSNPNYGQQSQSIHIHMLSHSNGCPFTVFFHCCLLCSPKHVRSFCVFVN